LRFLDEGRDLVEGKTERRQLFLARLGSFALQFVDGLIEFVFAAWIAAVLLEELVPGVAAAEANQKILLRQPECPEHVDEQSNQFRVRGRGALAENVRV